MRHAATATGRARVSRPEEQPHTAPLPGAAMNPDPPATDQKALVGDYQYGALISGY